MVATWLRTDAWMIEELVHCGGLMTEGARGSEHGNSTTITSSRLRIFLEPRD
jgi:hypothetical protein